METKKEGRKKGEKEGIYRKNKCNEKGRTVGRLVGIRTG